MTYLL